MDGGNNAVHVCVCWLLDVIKIAKMDDIEKVFGIENSTFETQYRIQRNTQTTIFLMFLCIAVLAAIWHVATIRICRWMIRLPLDDNWYEVSIISSSFSVQHFFLVFFSYSHNKYMAFENGKRNVSNSKEKEERCVLCVHANIVCARFC